MKLGCGFSLVVWVPLLLIATAAMAATEADKTACAHGVGDERIAACNRIIDDPREGPNNRAVSYLNRGVGHGRRGDHDRAIADFDQALRLKPDYPQAFASRGSAYTNRGIYDRAIADFDRALRLRPDFAEAYGGRGRAHLRNGEHDRAIADLNEALRLKPDYAVGYGMRGDALATKGQYDKAIADYTEAIRLDPRLTGAYYSRGRAYEQKGQHDQARRDYQSALAVTPRDEASRKAQETARKRLDEMVERQRADAEEKRKAAEAARRAADQGGQPMASPKGLAPQLSQPVISGRRVALVIGNSKYSHWQSLLNPTRDAGKVSALLRQHGFKVIEKQDLSYAEFHASLDDFQAEAQGADDAIVFYAGHGMNLAGRDILAPADMGDGCESGPTRRAIELEAIFKAIRPARHKIVLLDACRNNPFPRCPGRGSGDEVGFRGLSRIHDTGLLIVSSTQIEAKATDGLAGSGSPFANALVTRLSQYPRMDLVLLLRKVAQDVERATDGQQRTEVKLVGAGPETCLSGVNCSQ